MSIKSKASFGLMVGWVVMTIVVVLFSVECFGYIAAARMSQSAKNMYENNVAIMKRTKNVWEYFETSQKVTNSFLRGEYDAEKAVAELTKASNDAQKSWKTYSSGNFTVEEKDINNNLTPIIARVINGIETEIAAISANDKAKTEELRKTLGDDLIKINDGLNSLFDIQYTASQNEYTSSEAQLYMVHKIFIGAAVMTLLICIIAFLIVQNWIITPIKKIAGSMTEIAEERYNTEIPYISYTNELGRLATALNVFKKNGLERQRMTEEQLMEAKVQQERSKRMEQLTKEFDSSVTETINSVSTASLQMKKSATSMASMAEASSKQSNSVAQESREASGNVQTMAAAAEELSASIAEISQRIEQSTIIAGKAMEDSSRANITVQELSETATNIGNVIDTINAIAGQINLLALNATIEAARAGDAGKGFAVVASEVKNLASQTAKATDEIAQQISSIQKATTDTVSVIKNITVTIENINNISSNIATAVTEQSAVTREIASNAQNVAASTSTVSSDILHVTESASKTGDTANQVMNEADQLSKQADNLRNNINNFLNEIRKV